MFLPDLTVVVTTFKRPGRLRRCLQSLVDAGVGRVVVTGSCSTIEDAQVCEEFPQLKIVTSFLEGDLGCNETWIRGVTFATTKYILILHDDDWLLPEFGATYTNEIYPQLKRGIGFATWRGKVVSDVGEVIEEVGCLRGATRVGASGTVTYTLLDSKVTSPSPVISIFRRDVALRTLRECENVFTDKKHFTRPNMMVGNDLMLYLRHAEQFDSWLFIDKILTCYGGHFGSETAKFQGTDRLPKLLRVYDAARDYYKVTRFSRVAPTPKFFHLTTDYTPTDPETLRRRNFARLTWNFMYAWGECYPTPIRNGLFRTSQEVVGDVRPLPFLRDMLDYAAFVALDEDVIMLSNDDICFVPDAIQKLRQQFDSGANALFAWRYNFFHPLTRPLKDLRTGFKDGGVDLIAFRPAIWRQYREQFPDFILGCEAWDYCYRTLIPELPGGREMDGIIYHEMHDPIWRQTKVRSVNPGQRYNRQLARNFFARRAESHGNIPRFKDKL